MKKIKGSIFISNVTKALEHEWFVDYIDKNKFDLQFILFNANHSELHRYLLDKGFVVKVHQLSSNFYLLYYTFYYWLMLLFKRPQLVHCHLFQASIIGIVAAKFAGIRKRIYTRHHSDMHHVYHQHAVKYDLLVNRLSTHIIAVSQNSFNILTKRENVPPSKVTIINHGIPKHLMQRNVPEQDIAEMRNKYLLEGHSPIVGVVSRFVPEKGIQYTIPAFKKLLQVHPKAKLVLANGRGAFKPEIDKLLASLPADAYVIIPFELKIDALFRNFTMFVHASVSETSEAFGQVYLETMVLGIPMICTISGIAKDIVIDKRNALVVKYEDVDSIFESMQKLTSDAELRAAIVEGAHQDVEALTFEIKFEKIMSLYLN